MNKQLSTIAVVMISVILVILIYQTFILKQYLLFNYIGILAFIIFLAISLHDMRNAEK